MTTNRPLIRTPDQRLRVFISSTLEELADEREAARRAVISLRLAPVLFELGASPHSPRDLYQGYLSQSHIFVGIYGEKYTSGEEFFRLEDEYALASDMPKLIYVKSSNDREPRLSELLDRIRSDDMVSYKYFTTSEELQALIQDDLALMLTERFEVASSSEPDQQMIRHSTIPISATAFVGRELEEKDLRSLLEDPDVRLLTITGPAGIGKSRLALKVAAGIAGEFRDGIAFVPLATISDPLLIATTIAGEVGIRESSQRSVLETLKGFLVPKQLLLILDNFEHVAAGAPVLSELLAACPDLKILVTSRAVLLLRGEREYLLPPLDLPDSGSATVEDVARSESVRLFVDRAQAANPSFELNESNASAIAEICTRLDGLPLAIELAAARTRLLTPDAILTRLTNRLELLTVGPRDLPARQQTLRAALDWDYELLSPEEQTVFRRLGVFAGFALPSAEAVVALGDDGDVLAIVESLVGKSLLRTVDPHVGEPRFSMLRTLREYAFDRLKECGEQDAIKDRHAHHFLDVAEDAHPRLRGPEQVKWLGILELEHDNMRASLRWLASKSDAVGEMRLAGALGPFWEFHSHLSEGQRWLEQALSRTVDVPAEVRARCLDGAGMLARTLGELKRAATLLEEAVALRRQLGDPAALAGSLKNLGTIARERVDYDMARVLNEESLELCEAIGDKRGVAEVLNNLGVIAEFSKQWDDALSLYSRALAGFEEEQDEQGIARVLMNLGEVRLELGEFRTALELLKRSIRICRAIGSQWDMADMLDRVAYIMDSEGRHGDAVRLLSASDAIRETLGTPLPPMERMIYETRLEKVRAHLDGDRFVLAWSEGREVSYEDAVEFALSY